MYFRRLGNSTQLFDQHSNTQFSNGYKILFDRGKRGSKKFCFRNIVKSNDGNVPRHVNAVFFEGSNRAQRHLIICRNQRGELSMMILDQLVASRETSARGPIALQAGAGLQAGCLQRL